MITQIEQWIARLQNPNAVLERHGATWIPSISAEHFVDLLDKTTGFAPFSRQTVNIDVLRATLEQVPQWAAQIKTKSAADSIDIANSLSELYAALANVPEVPRQNLLRTLATLGGKKNLHFFCDLILNDPPNGSAEATTPFLPLFQKPNSDDVELVFPKLLDGLANPHLAPAILDLANFYVRTKRAASHPAAERHSQLSTLLDGLTTGLKNLQTAVEDQNESAEAAYQRYNDSIALVVSLCDALALIGNAESVPTLNRLFELRHRRVHVEAAAALARLDQENGRKALAALAAEPAARLRVLNYATELNLADTISEEFRTPVAIAESELVAFLAEPTNMGVPPSSCELVDSCTQYWPGYEEPRMCYLFRYAYQGLDADQRELSYSNIGIAGPLVHVFRADLGDRPVADIYGAFAGWQTEHEEIYESTLEQLNPADLRIAGELGRRIDESDYPKVTSVLLGSFFGEKVLVAEATKSGEEPGSTIEGSLIIDAQDIHWFPRRSKRSIDCEMAYNIYKGKRLLKAFNE